MYKMAAIFILIGTMTFTANVFDVLPIMSGVSIARAQENTEVKKLIDKARDYVIAGNNKEAIKIYTEAIQLDPENDWLYNYRSTSYACLFNRKREAFADINKAIELNPNEMRHYEAKAELYRRYSQYGGAIKMYDWLIEQNPNEARYYHNRGWVYQLKGKKKLAAEDYKKYLSLWSRPEDDMRAAGDYCERGVTYRYLKDYENAIKEFTKAIELYPNVAAYYELRGKCYKAIGDNARAQADFAKAKQLGG